MAKIRKLPKFVKLIKPAKPVKSQFDLKGFAEIAAKSAADGALIGAFIEVVDEGDGVSTFLFEANKLGYLGWRWSVTIFQADPATEPSLSEVVLIPGTDSLSAPNWIPWSERLADYQALQAELEKQAALDAENAIEDETLIEEETELAVADLEVSEDAKN